MLTKGSIVRVRPTPPGLTAVYPAAKWLRTSAYVELREDAPDARTLDVVSVLADGLPRSVYAFNITDVLQSGQVV